MRQKYSWGMALLAIIVFLIGTINVLLTLELVPPIKLTPKEVVNEDVVEVQALPTFEITIINPDNCEECTSLQDLPAFIEKQNGSVAKTTTLAQSDPLAQELITSKQVTKLPTAIITGELDKDPNLSTLFTQLGFLSDNAIVVTNFLPPYLDLASNEVKGKIELTLLYDRSCDTCYDPSIHEDSLRNLGVGSINSTIVEINSSEGKDLINKYDIGLVPTIIIRGDYEEYNSLMKVWPSVGTQEEEDDTLVFRSGVAASGTYKNLSTGEIVVKEDITPNTFENVSSEVFQNLLTQPDVIILDVRTQEEYDEGHLENSTLIPVTELEARLSEIDKNKKVLVYCKSGNRSAKASQLLIDNGYSDVVNLKNGIMEWESKGLPVIK